MIVWVCMLLPQRFLKFPDRAVYENAWYFEKSDNTQDNPLYSKYQAYLYTALATTKI